MKDSDAKTPSANLESPGAKNVLKLTQFTPASFDSERDGSLDSG
jgi:hypothetical protein